MSNGKPSIVPNVPEMDIMSSTMSLFVAVSGRMMAAGFMAIVSSTGPLYTACSSGWPLAGAVRLLISGC